MCADSATLRAVRDGVDFQPNPVLVKPKRFGATRKEEIAHNQLRLGSTQFVNGRFERGCRWGGLNGRERCLACETDMTPWHFLFGCKRFAAQRAVLREAFDKVMEERRGDRRNQESAPSTGPDGAFNWTNSEVGCEPPGRMCGHDLDPPGRDGVNIWNDDFYSTPNPLGESREDEDWCEWGNMAILGCYPEGVFSFLRGAELWVESALAGLVSTFCVVCVRGFFVLRFLRGRA